jgi:hypothetical protein
MKPAAVLALVLAVTACDSSVKKETPPPATEPIAAPAPVPEPAPKRTYSFSGRVVSELAEPVTVHVGTIVPWLHGMERDMPKESFDAVVAPGETFRFEGMKGGEYWLKAESASSAKWEYGRVIVRDDVRDYEIRIQKACTLVGRVIFGEGVNPADCWIDWSMHGAGISLGRGVNPNGRFRLERLEPGKVSLLVRHWPDRDAQGNAGLRVESRAEATLVPGENVVEWKLDKDSTPAK